MSSIFMRFPGGKGKALTLSYDDGVEQDIQLVDIMRKHGLRGTFNINSGMYAEEDTKYPEKQIHRRLSKSNALNLYKESGMEVAIHGLNHSFLEQLPVNLCVEEILQDRKNLERDFGGIIRGMAYPFGNYNNDVINVLKHCDIAYARTVQSTHRFDVPTDWLRWHPTCHHNDSKLMELVHSFADIAVKYAPLIFYLWGHSYEFEEHNNWRVIEEFGENLGCHGDIWYATNMEIFEYITAYRQLSFSMDCSCVYNPTASKLYFEMGNQTYCVNPGERLNVR